MNLSPKRDGKRGIRLSADLAASLEIQAPSDPEAVHGINPELLACLNDDLLEPPDSPPTPSAEPIEASVPAEDAGGAVSGQARKAEAERFLMLLDEEAEVFCFQIFDDMDSRKSSALAKHRHGTLDDLWPWLDAMNQHGAGVFVTVNETDGKGREKTNIVRPRAVFADFDPPKTAPAPLAYPLPPAWQVESSPGHRHAYWPVDGLSLADFQPMIKRVIATLGADPGINDLPRVMRLPGFYHMKNPATPHLVRLFDVDARQPYRPEQITAAFGQQQSACSAPPEQPEVPKGQDGYLADLLAGEDIHGSALKIVGRMVREGFSDALIKATFAGLALSVRDTRGADRAKALTGDELSRMIQGAREKGYAPPLLVDDSALTGKGAAAEGDGKLTQTEAETLIAWSWRTGTTLPDAREQFESEQRGMSGKPFERLRSPIAADANYSAPWIRTAWESGARGFLAAVDAYLVGREKKVAADPNGKPDMPRDVLKADAEQWMRRIEQVVVDDDTARALLERIGITIEDADSDFLTPPPRPTEAMFYGLVGDVARAASQGREVNRVSVAAAFMSWLSAQIGRDTFIQVGDVRHALQAFTLHVGRTAIAAKGESVSLVKRIDAEIRRSPLFQLGEYGVLGHTHDGGLSSREGLTLFVHDGHKVGRDEIPAIEDKRLWIFEPEFQNVIAQGKREGNTLSAALRDVWDGGSIKPATKGGRIWATEPHIALHGCITPFELRAGLEQNDISNGFGNRFLLVWAERTCLVALPKATPVDVVASLARRCETVIKSALGQYPASKYRREMSLSPEAEAVWVKAYRVLKRREPISETVTALLERRAPITLRLAGLFAIADNALVIGEAHMNAALAWSQYHRDSVVFVFGAEVEQRRKAMERDANREKILAFLRGKDWVVRSEIITKGFGGNLPVGPINDALQVMLADGEIEQDQRAKGGAAKGHKTFYRVSRTKDTKDTKDTVDADSVPYERRTKDERKSESTARVREVV